MHRLGDRSTGLQSITDELGIAAHITGLGSVFIPYFLEGEVRGYRDLLRNDDEAYAGFHRRMIEKGSFMYPMALKRNHISLAHTEVEIDRTLAQAREVLGEMAREGVFAPRAESDMSSLSAPCRAASPCSRRPRRRRVRRRSLPR